jgi:small subunit ribosomal protein S6e
VSHLRKLFGLRKKDDVRKYVVRREIKKGDKTFYSAPRIQRLITEQRLRRKRITKKTKLDRFKASKENKAKYEKLLSNYLKEKKAAAKKTQDETDKK